jgi:homoserine O-acetyltransferase
MSRNRAMAAMTIEMVRFGSTALAALLMAMAAPCVSAHWPGQPEHHIADLGEFGFEDGGSIPNLRISYVTHGKLNAAKDNAILFMHGFAANHHSFDHLIGPGRALDTEKYFIICTDELGNPQTTFEHSSSPTNTGLRMSFPAYKPRDRLNAEYRLVTQALGIPHLLAAGGISSGADASVQMAVSYPQFVDGIFPISGGALYSTSYFYFVPLFFSILESCPGWNGGNYEQNPKTCAYNAMIALIAANAYTPAWWDQYVDSPEAYTKWRNTTGEYYYDIQDARDLHYLQRSLANSWVGDTPGFNGDLNAILGSIKATTWFFANPTDLFVAKHLYETMAQAIPGSKLVWIESVAGHLMCCNADPNATRALDAGIKAFLIELTAKRSASK